MPISITVKLNERTLKTVHIARIGNDISRVGERVHTYAAIESATEPTEFDYETSPVTFEHKYSDDILVCVEKALHALNIAGPEK